MSHFKASWARHAAAMLLSAVALVSAAAQAQTMVEYIHTDALGSPIAVTNQVGHVVERTDYEPYGAVINQSAPRNIGFTGHVHDGLTSAIYMQQRYYDPTIGKFMSADPVEASPDTGANFNRYWYADSSPYVFFDPDGRCTGSRIKNEDGTCVSTGEYTTTPSASSKGPFSGRAERPADVPASNVGPQLQFGGQDEMEGCDITDDYCGRSWRDGTNAKNGLISSLGALLPALRIRRAVPIAAPVAHGVLKVGPFTYTRTAAAHLPSRPYMNSVTLIHQIRMYGRATLDAPGVLRYTSAGMYRGSKGTWELVVNERTQNIYHFLFVGAK